MGVTAGLKARQIIDNMAHILAIELMAGAQGVDFRREILGPESRQGRGTAAAYALLRRDTPFIERDCLMYPYIERTRELVEAGAVAGAVDAALGETSNGQQV